MLTNFLLLCRVGVFATLTNSYAIVAIGGSENFYRYLFPSVLVEKGYGLTSRLRGIVSLKLNYKM